VPGLLPSFEADVLPFIHIVVKTFESRYIYDTLTAQEVLNVN
jgi:hypothetical protein